MKIKVKKKREREKKVPINSAANRIEQIKSMIQNCRAELEPCEVEVFEMWTTPNNAE